MKFVRAIAAVALTVFAGLASAGTIKPFDQAAFDHLAAEGKPIVITVQAPWCPICKKQDPIQASLMETPAYKDYTLFTIDFDSQKALLAKYHVTSQSTIISYHGKTEVGRSVGDTHQESIDALMKKAAG